MSLDMNVSRHELETLRNKQWGFVDLTVEKPVHKWIYSFNTRCSVIDEFIIHRMRTSNFLTISFSKRQTFPHTSAVCSLYHATLCRTGLLKTWFWCTTKTFCHMGWLVFLTAVSGQLWCKQPLCSTVSYVRRTRQLCELQYASYSGWLLASGNDSYPPAMMFPRLLDYKTIIKKDHFYFNITHWHHRSDKGPGHIPLQRDNKDTVWCYTELYIGILGNGSGLEEKAKIKASWDQ